MRVSDLMNTRPVTLEPECPVTEASRVLTREDIGSAPVCESGGRLIGMLTDRDIVTRCIAAHADPDKTAVRDIMTRGVVSVHPDEDARNAARLMSGEQVRRLPVTENGRLTGMVTLCDLARREDCRMECAQAMEAVSANITRR